MDKEQAIQVLIVDDHAIFRAGVRSMLEEYPDIRVVGEARNGLEAIFLVEKFRPNVVLMDINMPKMNGIEATSLITNDYPETSIIGLSVDASHFDRSRSDGKMLTGFWGKPSPRPPACV